MVNILIEDKIVPHEEILSVTVSDRAGRKSDIATFELSPYSNVPKPFSSLTVDFIGNDTSCYCGKYYVQSVERKDNSRMIVKATAVKFDVTQKNKHSNTYKDTTLKKIVETIAKRQKLKVKFECEDIEITSTTQTKEDDLDFLDRLAVYYDVLFSLKNNFLVFVERDSDTLPIVDINMNFCSTSSVLTTSRLYYNSCRATFYDVNTAKEISVVTGEGEPVLGIDGSFRNVKEATIKAKIDLKKSKRKLVVGSLTTLGLKAYAGTKLRLSNSIKDENNKVFAIESVTHRWTRESAWSTSISFENL